MPMWFIAAGLDMNRAMTKQQAPEPPQTEADALVALADLVLVEPGERAEPAQRYEQLRQAWKEYLEADRGSDELSTDAR